MNEYLNLDDEEHSLKVLVNEGAPLPEGLSLDDVEDLTPEEFEECHANFAMHMLQAWLRTPPPFEIRKVEITAFGDSGNLNGIGYECIVWRLPGHSDYDTKKRVIGPVLKMSACDTSPITAVRKAVAQLGAGFNLPDQS